MNRVEHAIEIARGMLSVPSSDSCGPFIQEHRREYIWDDDENYVERWNALAGAGAGLEDVAQRFDEAGQPFLTYQGKTVKVPIVFERGDGTICVFTLARLVAADSEIRMCADTCVNSEYVYFPLPPSEWLNLEAAFGFDVVGSRFLRLPDTLDGFYRAIEEAMAGSLISTEDAEPAAAPGAPPPATADVVEKWEPLIQALVVRALGALCIVLGGIVAWATVDATPQPNLTTAFPPSNDIGGYFVFAPIMVGFGIGYPIFDFILRVIADYLNEAPIPVDDKSPSEPILNKFLEVWRTPDMEIFVPACLAACDFHTQRCGNTRKGGEQYEFSSRHFTRTPVEILMVFKLRNLLGLANPTLDHPLMNTILGQLPEEIKFEEIARPPDDLIHRVRQRMQQDGYDDKLIFEKVVRA